MQVPSSGRITEKDCITNGLLANVTETGKRKNKVTPVNAFKMYGRMEV